MATWDCQGCSAVFSVGAPGCPQCGGTEYRENGDDGPIRSTVTGEPVRMVGEHGPELAAAGKPRRKPDASG